MPTTIEHKKRTRGNTAQLARYLSNNHKLDMHWGHDGVDYHNLGRCQNIPKAVEKFLEVQEEAKDTSRDVNYHLIVAFDPKDTITHHIMQESEKQCVHALGLQEHQRISVIHTNTHVPHLHIQINRVHPIERTQEGYLRLNALSFSQQKLKNVRHALERQYQLTKTESISRKVNKRKIYKKSIYKNKTESEQTAAFSQNKNQSFQSLSGRMKEEILNHRKETIYKIKNSKITSKKQISKLEHKLAEDIKKYFIVLNNKIENIEKNNIDGDFLHNIDQKENLKVSKSKNLTQKSNEKSRQNHDKKRRMTRSR